MSIANAAPTAKPAINLQSTPSSVSMGEAVTLTWSVNDAQSCTASGGWSGSKPTSGHIGQAPSASTSYTLTCTGPGGTTAQSRQIVVIQLPPIVTLLASPHDDQQSRQLHPDLDRETCR